VAESNTLISSVQHYFKPQVMAMAALGVGAGLPFLLVFSTLNYWLADEGVSKSTIGFFAAVGITYSIKVIWAPLIDQWKLPLLSKLGRRRSWIFLGQLGIALALFWMSLLNPQTELQWLALASVVVAFSSATQDVALDAWRIEAIDEAYQGLMSASYIFGYRVGLLIAGAGSLYLADFVSWQFAYQSMALFMLLPMLVLLVLSSDAHVAAVHDENWRALIQRVIVNPFKNFFSRYGRASLAILAFVALYRLSDIAMGGMANPLYSDLGFSKSDVASIAKIFGFFMTILGAFACGFAVVRFGVIKPLFVGAILVATTNLLFAWLSVSGADLTVLTLVISADNLAAGIANTAFVAFLSSLTDREYTATQYALFSSFMTLPGKLFSTTSGVLVESYGFTDFFFICAGLGIPAILLLPMVARVTRRVKAQTALMAG
jgi:PAT family beta-lactamase induction signal transducer AmpG